MNPHFVTAERILFYQTAQAHTAAWYLLQLFYIKYNGLHSAELPQAVERLYQCRGELLQLFLGKNRPARRAYAVGVQDLSEFSEQQVDMGPHFRKE